MRKIEVTDLIKAGVHFGHLTRKWNPNMAPFIYMERNGIHIINLYKTISKLEEASGALEKIAVSGRKILFVATKKQAKDIVSEAAKKVNMPYITERWPGGMLTNFITIRKAVKKMSSIDRMKQDGTFNTLSKKEKLQIGRQREKLEKNLGSIANMTRLPGAIFVVDIVRENIAVKEAQKLNIPIFAMVDTNSDPKGVQYAIPSNDDASKSISKIIEYISDSIQTGLEERKSEKEVAEETKEVIAEETKKEVAEEAKKEVAEETKKEVAEEAKKEVAEETKKEVAEEAKKEVAEETKKEVAEETKKEVAEETKKEVAEETKKEDNK